jgi:hypothetical protein
LHLKGIKRKQYLRDPVISTTHAIVEFVVATAIFTGLYSPLASFKVQLAGRKMCRIGATRLGLVVVAIAVLHRGIGAVTVRVTIIQTRLEGGRVSKCANAGNEKCETCRDAAHLV